MRTKNNRSLLPSVRPSVRPLVLPSVERAGGAAAASLATPPSVGCRATTPTDTARAAAEASEPAVAFGRKKGSRERTEPETAAPANTRSVGSSVFACRSQTRGRSVGRSLEYKVTPARACDRPHQQGMIKSRPEWLSQISGQKRESDQGRRARAVRGRGWRIGLLSLSLSLSL